MEHPDDAGIVAMPGGDLLVQTVDLIAPIVNDPAAFGRIACANSLSDVYAMGGRPIAALNIACFPDKKLPIEVLQATMDGARAALAEAGCPLLGGHTVKDPEFKFGFSVSGIVEGGDPLTIDRARVGDLLVLTKPLGTGVVNQALRKGAIADDSTPYLQSQTSMGTLNAAGAWAARASDAHACTDITGFGLGGHAAQFARASGVTFALERAAWPSFDGVTELIAAGIHPAAAGANESAYGACVAGLGGDKDSRLLFDPQTSGGLLVALAEERLSEFRAHLGDWPLGVHVIGRVETAGEHDVVVL